MSLKNTQIQIWTSPYMFFLLESNTQKISHSYSTDFFTLMIFENFEIALVLYLFQNFQKYTRANSPKSLTEICDY